MLPQNEQERALPLVVETAVTVQGPPWLKGGPDYGPPTGPADAPLDEASLRASSSDRRESLDPDSRAKKARRSLKYLRDRSVEFQDRYQTSGNLPKIGAAACPNRRRHSCRRHKDSNKRTVTEESRRKTTERPRENIDQPVVNECCVLVNRENQSEQSITENINLWSNNLLWTNNITSVEPVLVHQSEWIVRCPPYQEGNIIGPKRLGKFANIIDNSNEAIKDVNKKVMAMAKAMTPTWSLRLLGVSCGSVVCAWGLLLILSVLGGATHNTGIGSFGLGTSAEDNINSASCPWACGCGGPNIDCSYRGLTQVPGDLAALLSAEKL